MSNDNLIQLGDMVVDDDGKVLVVVKEHSGAGCCTMEDSVTGQHYFMDRLVAYALKEQQKENK